MADETTNPAGGIRQALAVIDRHAKHVAVLVDEGDPEAARRWLDAGLAKVAEILGEPARPPVVAEELYHDPRFGPLPPIVAARLEVALTLGAHVAALAHLAGHLARALPPDLEPYGKALTYHVEMLTTYFEAARREGGW